MPSFLNDFLQQFHFLRPLWLFAFLPMFLLLLWSWKQHKSSQSWLKVIDEKLQPFVLTQASEDRRQSSKWLPFLALIICIVSLAGPVWLQLPQAVYKPQSALVIALDLSRSMDAVDIKPSRLSRAKLKIIDLLNARKEGQTALVAYAAQAFTVSPLTDDTDTVEALLKSLSTDIMPAQGSRMDVALQTANDLMAQAGIQHGHILVVSDGVSLKEFNAIKELGIENHTISILAVGTEEGAPISQPEGGYLKDAAGQIVVAKMNRQDLLSIAQASGGVFATLRHDDDDINALLDLMDLNHLDNKTTKSDKTYDVWYEHGSWLLLLVVPMAVMAFRKGLLVLAMAIILPMPQQAEAMDWQQWFKNSDQKAAEQFKAGEYESAEQQFKQSDWRAAAQYKNKHYEDALQHYEQADDFYNKGNALAKMEQYEQAIEMWDKVLKKQPKHEDAAYNKKQVEEFLKQQQQQDQKQDQQSKDDQQKQDQKKQKSDQKDQQKQQQSSSDEQQENQDQKSEQEKSEDEKETDSKDQENDQESEQEKQQQAEKEQQQKSDAEKKQAEEQKEDEKTAEQLAAEQELKEEMSDPLDEETKQWLRRVPDDPGGLMRNKFRYQYKQLNRQNDEQNPW